MNNNDNQNSNNDNDNDNILVCRTLQRWPWGRVSKEMESLHRPRVVLTACIAHGWCVELILSSEKELHGADFFCEVVARTLQRVHDIAQQKQRQIPDHLVVFSDNTVSQAKNELSCVFLAYLSASHWASVTLCFLIVGHTHEDVDQLFALVLAIIRRIPHGFQVPEDIVSFLHEHLQPKILSRGEELHTTFLRGVRSFDDWLSPLGLGLSGAFATRRGIESPHCFMFVRGHALTPSQRAMWSGPEAGNFHGTHIYCCVKNFIRDTKLQEPMAYLPKWFGQLFYLHWLVDELIAVLLVDQLIAGSLAKC